MSQDSSSPVPNPVCSHCRGIILPGAPVDANFGSHLCSLAAAIYERDERVAFVMKDVSSILIGTCDSSSTERLHPALVKRAPRCICEECLFYRGLDTESLRKALRRAEKRIMRAREDRGLNPDSRQLENWFDAAWERGAEI